MPFVSIIVPIYNTEKFLDECIQCVLVQSYEDWELLLVNDGSTDKSPSICEKYESLDTRIRVIHKENTGVSDSRNKAIDLAQGEYIMFLDADDYWLDSFFLQKFVEIINVYDLDILRGEYKAVDILGNELLECPLTNIKQQYANKILTSSIFYTNIMCGENFLWLSMVRRSVIGDLRFNTNRSFLEDMEFYANLLLKSLRCMYIPFRFYAYRKNENSASNIPKIKNLIDSFSMTDVFDRCSQEAKDNELRKSYRYNSIMMYYWTLDTMSQTPYYEIRLNLIKDLSLTELNKRVCLWANSTNKFYPLPIYISPLFGIYYFRLRHKLGRLLRKFRII